MIESDMKNNVGSMINSDALNEDDQNDSKCVNTHLSTFTKFRTLPAELRLLIWKEQFVPRRVIIRTSHSQQVLGLKTSPARLLLVNKEANQIFRENYASCFCGPARRRDRPVYINYDIDTLCLNAGIQGLRRLKREYPASMRDLQWLDIKANDKVMEWFRDRASFRDLFPSLKLITVRTCATQDTIQPVFESEVPLCLEALKQIFWGEMPESGEPMPRIAVLMSPEEILAGIGRVRLGNGRRYAMYMPRGPSYAFKGVSQETYARCLIDIDQISYWKENRWPSILETGQPLVRNSPLLSQCLDEKKWMLKEITPQPAPV